MTSWLFDRAGMGFVACVLLLCADALVHFALGAGYHGVWAALTVAVGCVAALLFCVMIVDDYVPRGRR